MIHFTRLLFYFITLLNFVFSEIAILSPVQVIYDESPKIRVKATGFDADDHDITLDLGTAGASPLKGGKDYLITKDDDGIILKLLSNRRWANLDGRVPPVPLLLRSVKFDGNDRELLPSPSVIANIIETPTVFANDRQIYQTATNALYVNGSGFIGAKFVDLYFNPPLNKEIDYEIVTKFPLKKSFLQLRIRDGFKWSQTVGPLKVVGVDTGGGPVKVNGDEGIIIAYVVEDLDEHDVSVLDTSVDQRIYHDERSIIIKGTGFNPDNTAFKFSNGLVGDGVNFTISSLTETSATLKLTGNSLWRANMLNLPGYLTVLAVNAGGGYVSVGPTNSGKGKDVATVFERPYIFSSNTKIYRTHTHELHIKGTGFPLVLGSLQLEFTPSLKEDIDYTITVIDRTEAELTLLDKKAWSSESGPLIVTRVNTKGTDDGWITLPGEGVHVADIQDDVSPETTGGVEVIPMATKVYQSILKQSIDILGSGFVEDMIFTFEPALELDRDYFFEFSSSNRVTLTLRENKKWRKDAGFLIVKAVTVKGKKYNLAGGLGIRIATILTDPIVNTGSDNIHESQSKVVPVKGHGFTNSEDLKLVIRPTLPSSYKLLSVLEDAIRVQLLPDKDWLPDFLSLNSGDADKKIPLQISSIDTGAGEIVFTTPITIGFIVKDREGVICDDSCEFAFDGVCDDGTAKENYYYYEEYGYYMDDFNGGYGAGNEYYAYYGDTNRRLAETTEYGYGNENEEYGDGYGAYAYDDYYMWTDEYRVSACLEGTDCTDCGGVDAIIDYSKPDGTFETCTNTCPYARDGICDDPRGASYCALGTDCQDCGPVGQDNFTVADDEGWDDDDDYWTFNDGNFLEQTKGLKANRHKVPKRPKQEVVAPAAMFLTVLEGMVYTIGAVFAAAALILIMRWHNGQSLPFMQVFNPESAVQDIEVAPLRRMPITPDVIRT
jgi:hypothetical protein